MEGNTHLWQSNQHHEQNHIYNTSYAILETRDNKRLLLIHKGGKEGRRGGEGRGRESEGGRGVHTQHDSIWPLIDRINGILLWNVFLTSMSFAGWLCESISLHQSELGLDVEWKGNESGIHCRGMVFAYIAYDEVGMKYKVGMGISIVVINIWHLASRSIGTIESIDTMWKYWYHAKVLAFHLTSMVWNEVMRICIFTQKWWKKKVHKNHFLYYQYRKR